MTGDQAIINILIEQCKSFSFPRQELAELEAKHGVEVRRTLERIYAYTNMGGSNEDMDRSAGAMRAALARDYPWLTEAALMRLSWMMTMIWK